MKYVAMAAALAAASSVNAAVTNGNFATGLIGWVWTPDPGAEASMVAITATGPFVTGDAFRVNPGNNSGAAAQLGGTLSQSIALSAGVNYTVSGDLGVQNLTLSPNADGGLIRVFLGGSLIHSFDVDFIPAQTTQIHTFAVPFNPAATSNYLLEISFQRGFFNSAPTMYHWADNIAIVPAPGAIAFLSLGVIGFGRRRH